MNKTDASTETYKRGERVKHATKPEWGLGEVLNDQVGDHVQVIFEDAGLKTFKVGVAPFVAVGGEEANSDYLSSLVKRHLRPTRAARAAGPPVSLSALAGDFLRHFPRGFHDPQYLAEERDYKECAHQLFLKDLGEEALLGLLAAGDYAEVCRRAQALMNKTNLISPYERMWLRSGLDSSGRKQLSAQALGTLLYGQQPEEARFGVFVDALRELQALKWPVATYFLFARFPERHIFLKPEVTKHIANALRIDIRYAPEVTWSTYSAVLELAEGLKSKLASHDAERLSARDMIDIQSFIWVIGAYDR